MESYLIEDLLIDKKYIQMKIKGLEGLNEVAKFAHEAAKSKGFYKRPCELGTALMLTVSEIGEALEADRHGKYAKLNNFIGFNSDEGSDVNVNEIKSFQDHVKDTFEDEIADTMIRLLDLCGDRGIDIEKHIELKMKYNSLREPLHGKRY